MVQQQTQAPPAGISGKRVTAWVVLGLVALGVTLSYTLWSYGTLNAARKVSSQQWREVADGLSLRYQTVAASLEAAVASGALTNDASKRFTAAMDRFRTTADANEQELAAVEVEGLLRTDELVPAVAGAVTISPKLQSQVVEFNRVRQIERDRLESLGGKIVDLFLKIPLPTKFELAAANQGGLPTDPN